MFPCFPRAGPSLRAPSLTANIPGRWDFSLVHASRTRGPQALITPAHSAPQLILDDQLAS